MPTLSLRLAAPRELPRCSRGGVQDVQPALRVPRLSQCSTCGSHVKGDRPRTCASDDTNAHESARDAASARAPYRCVSMRVDGRRWRCFCLVGRILGFCKDARRQTPRYGPPSPAVKPPLHPVRAPLRAHRTVLRNACPVRRIGVAMVCCPVRRRRIVPLSTTCSALADLLRRLTASVRACGQHPY